MISLIVPALPFIYGAAAASLPLLYDAYLAMQRGDAKGAILYVGNTAEKALSMPGRYIQRASKAMSPKGVSSAENIHKDSLTGKVIMASDQTSANIPTINIPKIMKWDVPFDPGVINIPEPPAEYPDSTTTISPVAPSVPRDSVPPAPVLPVNPSIPRDTATVAPRDTVTTRTTPTRTESTDSVSNRLTAKNSTRTTSASPEPNDNKPGIMKRMAEWSKKHPYKATGIGLGIATGVYPTRKYIIGPTMNYVGPIAGNGLSWIVSGETPFNIPSVANDSTDLWYKGKVGVVKNSPTTQNAVNKLNNSTKRDTIATEVTEDNPLKIPIDTTPVILNFKWFTPNGN